MGSFSYTRADYCTKRSNLTTGDKYKILVPIEFGGGYIVDYYFDYGYVNYGYDDEAKYIDAEGNEYKDFPTADLYGILYYWNNYTGDEWSMYGILYDGDTDNDDIRGNGIDIGCSDVQVDRLKYPLKLVSMSYKGNYEDCHARSYSDPNQGFVKGYWTDEEYKEYQEKILSRKFGERLEKAENSEISDWSMEELIDALREVNELLKLSKENNNDN